MVKELLTREDYFDAVNGGEGVIGVVDSVRGLTAPPVARPTIELRRFIEKVIKN